MTYIIRAARSKDMQQIYEMAKSTGGGFTNLPPELERSTAAFTRDDDQLSDDLFVFVLENTETGKVHGTCQIFAQIGLKWPFYSYRIGSLTQHSEELGRTFRADILNLSTDLEGASEVGGLFLHPSARSGGLGLLIARSRYLFIRNHRSRFADNTLAELRGVIDEAGGSPFWDGVAGRFFGMNFQDADEFNATHGNQFIADLMPKHPVYTAMLSEHARSVIGVPHPSGRAAMRMLENEGFTWEKYVDIFDGGPTMTVKTDKINSIKNAKDYKLVAIGDTSTSDNSAEKMLVTVGRLADFKCAYGQISINDDGATIDTNCAAALNLNPGDSITCVARS
jgi:arginine N-succinyltransferase